MGRIGRFFSLSRRQRGLWLAALFLLFGIRILREFLSFQTLRRFLVASPPPLRRTPSVSPVQPSTIGWAVGAASRYVPGANCLVQAMAVHLLLRREGLPSVFRIGVSRDETGCFEAHAWVESGDEIIVGGAGLERYTPLGALPSCNLRRSLKR